MPRYMKQWGTATVLLHLWSDPVSQRLGKNRGGKCLGLRRNPNTFNRVLYALLTCPAANTCCYAVWMLIWTWAVAEEVGKWQHIDPQRPTHPGKISMIEGWSRKQRPKWGQTQLHSQLHCRVQWPLWHSRALAARGRRATVLSAPFPPHTFIAYRKIL